MKKPTKPQQEIIDFLTEMGGEGHIATGYRYTRRGVMKASGTPVLCTFAQAFTPMLDRGMVERVGDSRSLFRLVTSS